MYGRNVELKLTEVGISMGYEFDKNLLMIDPKGLSDSVTFCVTFCSFTVVIRTVINRHLFL